MTRSLTESTVEDATLSWLQELGYAVLHGPDIAAGEPAAERIDPEYRDVVQIVSGQQRLKPHGIAAAGLRYSFHTW